MVMMLDARPKNFEFSAPPSAQIDKVFYRPFPGAVVAGAQFPESLCGFSCEAHSRIAPL